MNKELEFKRMEALETMITLAQQWDRFTYGKGFANKTPEIDAANSLLEQWKLEYANS